MSIDGSGLLQVQHLIHLEAQPGHEFSRLRTAASLERSQASGLGPALSSSLGWGHAMASAIKHACMLCAWVWRAWHAVWAWVK